MLVQFGLPARQWPQYAVIRIELTGIPLHTVPAVYNYIPTVETPISLSVKCRGSDSGACNGVEPGTIVPFETCSIPTGSLDPAATIEKTCLTELGANYPDQDMSDILMIEVTVPEEATVGLVDAPIDVAN